MATPTIIRSTDTDAPVLANEDGAMYNVLKWALPQLGWTLEFDDAVNNQVAFRNDPSIGTGFYLKVYDNAADHGFNNGAKACGVRGYSAMTDINTGTDPIDAGGSLCYMGKSTMADATARDWMIMGTGTCFYLLVDRSGYGKTTANFVGDIASLVPGDTDNFLLYCSSNASPSTSTLWQAWIVNSDNVPIGYMPSMDGATPGARHYPSVQSIPAGEETGVYSNMGVEGTYPEPATGGIATAHVYIKQQSGNFLKGRIPGLIAPLNDVRDSSAFDWNAIYDPLNFQEVPDQLMPHGVGTLSLQRVDQLTDLNYSWSTATCVLAWDLGADWDNW